MESRRVEALADGIFAISMTLLVLEVHVPSLAATVSAGELGRGLLQTWPKLAAYCGSFLILGVLWIGHHNQFHYIRRADRPFLWINILFLMWVGFMPYCTALLGSFMGNHLAAAVYGGALILTGTILYAEWRYAATHGLLSDEATPEIVEATGKRIRLGLLGYAIALAVSLLSAPVGLALYVLIPLSYLRRGTIDRHLSLRHRQDHVESGPR
jgi:uncharacterized membrane protein